MDDLISHIIDHLFDSDHPASSSAQDTRNAVLLVLVVSSATTESILPEALRNIAKTGEILPQEIARREGFVLLPNGRRH